MDVVTAIMAVATMIGVAATMMGVAAMMGVETTMMEVVATMMGVAATMIDLGSHDGRVLHVRVGSCHDGSGRFPVAPNRISRPNRTLPPPTGRSGPLRPRHNPGTGA